MAGDRPATPAVDPRTADALRLLQAGAMEEAGQLLAAAAHGGCCEARLHIALILRCQGAEAPAQKFLTEAAEAGHVPAQLTLASWLQDAASPDMQGSCYWYEQAAQDLYARLPTLTPEETEQLVTAAHGAAAAAVTLGHPGMAEAYGRMAADVLKGEGGRANGPPNGAAQASTTPVTETAGQGTVTPITAAQNQEAADTSTVYPAVPDTEVSKPTVPAPCPSSRTEDLPLTTPSDVVQPVPDDPQLRVVAPAGTAALPATPGPSRQGSASGPQGGAATTLALHPDLCHPTTAGVQGPDPDVATLAARVTALEAVVRRQEALLAELHRRLTVPLPPPPTEGLLDIARLPPGYLITPDHCAVLKPKAAPPACVFLRIPLRRHTTYAWEVTLMPQGTPLGWSLLCGVATPEHPASLEPGQKSPTGAGCTAWAISHNRELCCSDAKFRPSLAPTWQANWLQPGGTLRLEFRGAEGGLACQRAQPKDRWAPLRFQPLPVPADGALVPVVWVASTFNDVLVRITAG